jgi:hypothetical protein
MHDEAMEMERVHLGTKATAACTVDRFKCCAAVWCSAYVCVGERERESESLLSGIMFFFSYNKSSLT